jgi:hypothetical protein
VLSTVTCGPAESHQASHWLAASSTLAAHAKFASMDTSRPDGCCGVQLCRQQWAANRYTCSDVPWPACVATSRAEQPASKANIMSKLCEVDTSLNAPFHDLRSREMETCFCSTWGPRHAASRCLEHCHWFLSVSCKASALVAASREPCCCDGTWQLYALYVHGMPLLNTPYQVSSYTCCTSGHAEAAEEHASCCSSSPPPCCPSQRQPCGGISHRFACMCGMHVRVPLRESK